LPICEEIDRNPLWPAMPPPTLTPHLGRRQFEFVLEHRDLAGRELEEVRSLLTARPESFMKVVGLSRTMRSRSSVPSEVSP